MNSADAVAATVLIRLATLWFAVAIGALMLFRLNGERAPEGQPLQSHDS
jgi:uncharacterized membrane protein YbhN (UPF0104 family)